MFIPLAASGCSHAARAQLGSGDRDNWMACKAWGIYFLSLYRKMCWPLIYIKKQAKKQWLPRSNYVTLIMTCNLFVPSFLLYECHLSIQSVSIVCLPCV